MKYLTDFLSQISDWTYNYFPHLLGAITASVLMIYGDDVILLVKRNTRKFHFVIRVAIFATVCSIGFMLLDTFLYAGLKTIIDNFTSRIFLFPIMLFSFVGIGILAERKKHI